VVRITIFAKQKNNMIYRYLNYNQVRKYLSMPVLHVLTGMAVKEQEVALIVIILLSVLNTAIHQKV
jgi:hypothetical protein